MKMCYITVEEYHMKYNYSCITNKITIAQCWVKVIETVPQTFAIKTVSTRKCRAVIVL